MPFPPKMLNDGEEVILDLQPHWSTLAGPAALLVVVTAATIAGYVAIAPLAGAVLGVALLVTAGWVAIRALRRHTTNFVITTDRLVYRSGLIAKHGKEIPLQRVNDISYRQTVLERLIGTGDLSIESAGASSRETFEDIPRPSAVQNEIYRQMTAAEDRHAQRAAGPREASVSDRLDQLEDLHRRGVISAAEYEAKKRQLLDRL